MKVLIKNNYAIIHYEGAKYAMKLDSNKFDYAYIIANKHKWILFKKLSILEYVELKTGITINALKIDVFQSHSVKNRVTIAVHYNKMLFASCTDNDKKKCIVSIIKQIKTK